MECIEEVGAVDGEQFKEKADPFEACEDVPGGGGGGGGGEQGAEGRTCSVSMLEQEGGDGVSYPLSARRRWKEDKVKRTFRPSRLPRPPVPSVSHPPTIPSSHNSITPPSRVLP